MRAHRTDTAALAATSATTTSDSSNSYTICDHDNCPSWCVTDHGAPRDSGWHKSQPAHVTAPALAANQQPGDEPQTLLSATVVRVADLPQVFGTSTRLWLDTPGDTVELTPKGVDALITNLEAFLPKLRAARDLLTSAVATDLPENPAAVERYMAELAERITAQAVTT